jgi:hypothetical protein
MIVLSRAEKEFINILNKQTGEEAIKREYTIDYIRQLKHRILKKRIVLTDDLVLVNQVLDKLQSL